MGNCCGGEQDHHTIDVKKGKRNNAGKAAEPGQETTAKGSIAEFCNDKVRQIHSQLEAYHIPEPTDGERVEARPMETLENDGKYEGEWSLAKNLRHGKGTQVWHDGSIYEGQWRNDKAHGFGRLIHADGDVYEGQWVEDKAHGQGVYTHTDGAQYSGDWKDDK